MLVSLFNRDRVTELVERAAQKECHFELKVHEAARAKHWRLVVDRLSLPVRTPDFGSGNDNGTAAAVIAYRQVLPVGHQRIFLASETDKKFDKYLITWAEIHQAVIPVFSSGTY